MDAGSLQELWEHQSLLKTLEVRIPGRAPMEVEIAGTLHQENDEQVIQLNVRKAGERKRADLGSPGASGMPQEPQTILLVVDDEARRGAVLRVLRSSGYPVIEAADGAQAMQALAAGGRPVDVLLANFQLPDMNGVDLAQHAAALSPDTRSLLMAGGMVFNGISSILPNKIEKPFDPEALARRVWEILNIPGG